VGTRHRNRRRRRDRRRRGHRARVHERWRGRESAELLSVACPADDQFACAGDPVATPGNPSADELTRLDAIHHHASRKGAIDQGKGAYLVVASVKNSVGNKNPANQVLNFDISGTTLR
jgi:hypothetical protein